MEFLSIKVRFSIKGFVYAFVMDKNGIEIVWLSGNVDRPEIVKTIYSGSDIHAAGRAIRILKAM